MSERPAEQSFDAFLADLASAPEAIVLTEHLPDAMRSASRLADRYRILDLAGRGGMGDVYRALDETLDRQVAIKVAHAQVRRGQARRWIREAEALARLSHPNIVEVFHVQSDHEPPFIVLEWIEGQTLAEWVADRPPWEEVLAVYAQAGAALAAAHAAGIVHRDFKPHNVLLGADRSVHVVDFGLAVSAGADSRVAASGAENRRETRPGTGRTSAPHGAAGTLGYMPPEQFAGQGPDPRADQYSFCAALFEALLGNLPFPGETSDVIWTRAVACDLAVPDDSSVPTWIVKVLRRGLQPAAARRYPDMETLLAALDPRRRRRRRRFLGGIVVVGLSVAGLWARAVESPDRDHCDEVAAGLDTTWNTGRAAELREAFAATGSPIASAAAQDTIARLDAHGVQWAAQRRAVCERSEGGELHHVVACLGRSRMRIEEVVSTLVGADRETVANTYQVLRELRPPALCDAAGQWETTGSGGAEGSAQAQRLVARSHAARAAGHPSAAVNDADRALAAARAGGLEAVVAEALLARGLAQLHTAPRAIAIADLHDAFWAATAARSDATAARAAREVLANTRIGPQHWGEALTWAGVARAAEQRQSGGAEPSWEYWQAHGRAAVHAERFAEARTDFEAALQRVRAEGGDPQLEIVVLADLSRTELPELHADAALRWSEQAVALAEKLPVDSPERAAALRVHADALVMAGRAREAVTVARTVVGIRRRLYGPTAPLLVDALNTLAQHLQRAGELSDAMTVHAEARAIVQGRDPVDPVELATVRLAESGTLYQLGRLEEARAALLDTVAVNDREEGPDSLRQAIAFVTLANVSLELREPAEAVDANTRALEIMDRVVPPGSPQRAGTLANRASALVALGEPAAALEDLEEARVILRRAGPDGAALRSLVEGTAAHAYLLLGERDRAVDASLRALAYDKAYFETPSPRLVNGYSNTASALLGAGEAAQAVEVLEEGLTVLDQTETAPDMRGKFLFDLARAEHDLGHRDAARRRSEESLAATHDSEARATVRAWQEANLDRRER